MSNRTLLEFNHDFGHEIGKHEEAFIETIMEMIRGGGTPNVVDRLKLFGVTYVGERHHSNQCSVEYPFHKVEL